MEEPRRELTAPHGAHCSAGGSGLPWDLFPAPHPCRKDLGLCFLLGFSVASMETEHKAAEQLVCGQTDRRAERGDGGGEGAGSSPCKHSQIPAAQPEKPRHAMGEQGAGEESDAGSAGIPLGKQISN